MTPTWRDRRLFPVLALISAGLWLYAYMPVISNDRVVGIASAIVGAVFLFLCAGGYA